MNLLVVDSNLQKRSQLEAVLQKGEYHITSAQHGEEALDILRNEPVDGIICAVFMPEMDGFQLCRLVKRNHVWKEIPFILFTDTVLEGNESFALDLGADLFLTTADPQEILSRIGTVLQTPKKSQYMLEEGQFFQQHSIQLKKKLDHTLEEMEKMRKRLSYSRKKYQKLFEGAHDATFILNAQGIHVEANEKASELLGYTVEEFKGLSFRDVVVSSAISDSEERLKKLLQGEDLPIYEKQFRTKEGKIIPVEISVSGIRDDSGNVVYIQSIVQDITKRKKAEQALRESEEKYRNVVEQAASGIAIVQDGVFKYVNPWLTEVTGYTTRELVDTPYTDYIHHQVPKVLGTEPDDKKMTAYEALLTCKQGHIHVEFIVGTTLYQGAPADLLIIQDITERKKAEEALHKSEKQYRDLFENAPLGIYRTTPDGRILMANPALVRMLGYSSFEELAKRDLEEEGYEAGYPRSDFKKQLEAEGQIIGLESSWKRKDGTTVFFRENAKAVRDDTGAILYYEGTIEDITESKQAAEQVRESEERYRNIVEMAPFGILTTDLKGTVTSCNTAFLNMTGFSESDIIGKHFTKLPTIQARDIPKYFQVLNSLIQGKIPKPFEAVWMHKDGTFRTGEAHVSFMKKEGKTTGVQIIVRDITERKKTEEKLKQSEEKYRTLVENLNVGVYRSTPGKKGKFIDVNPAFVKMLGYKEKEEIMNLEVKDIYCSPKDRVQFSEKASAQGFVKNEELHLKGKDGTSIIVSDTATTVRDADGTLLYFDGIMEDITERKKMEEALKESEERYRSLVENSRDSIVIIDLKGNVQFANKYTEELTGYTREEGLGMNVREITPLRYVPKILNMLKKAITGRPIPYFESVIRKKDGTLIPVESGGQAVFKDGKVVGIQIITRDIAERKQAEEELRTYRHHLEELVEERTTELKKANKQLKKEIFERKLVEESLAAEKERLSVTLRSIGDGVITTDIKGKVTLINKAAERLTGFTQEEAVGNPLDAVFRIIDENTRAPCESPVEKVISLGTVAGLGNNTVLIAKDGTERIIADSGAPIRDQNSRVIGVVLVFRDITESRKMEEEMLKAQKLESIGILAGGIAHDFNNILTAILGNVNLAKVYTRESEVTEKLTRIEKASLQAKDLTQQLLTFSKGGAPIKRTVPIADLIEESTRFALRGSNVRCHFHISADLWPVEIDEGQISQVINNLVINADQSMPEGGIIQVQAENVAVHLQQNVPLPPGKYVRITIKDQGVGIPAKYLSKIFDPYFTTKQEGSGLGLATTYSIIKQHTGHIDVESEVGVGTTFTVWLPASEIIVEPKQEEVSELLVGRGRVLLMDDEEIIREAAGEALQGLGYDVEVVKDGAEAITQYKNAQKAGTPFDVVIMDLTIPGGMGGRETIASLLEIDPEAKAIVSSGYSNDPIMADYRIHGFKGVVAKPYSVEELSKTLRNVIEGK